jgi:FKBP-type peptidyl-prolyl cis-trans isomerase FkpA
MKINLLLIVLLLSLSACKKKKNTESQATIDDNLIKKYIADNNLNATATGSGLYYVITTQGTGVNPTINSKVTVVYDGLLTNGTVFDQSPLSGATFNLSGVIKGWQEGIPFFKKGGKGTLLIPSALGYGSQATGKIPPNSVLIFNIQLIDVQ